MTEYISGSLYVIERPRSQHWVNRALKQLDERLFLERQVSFDNQHVWCVVCDQGDRPPITLIEFRDDNGNAISDPTERLIQRVAQMERDGHRLHQRVLDKNQRFREAKSKAMRDETEAITRDIVPRINPTRSVLLPRGAHLRQSRDRQRSQGARV
jgi:hypothetical protein